MWLTARIAYVGIVSVLAPLTVVVCSASTQPCPDVDVIFARGTGEPTGAGAVGEVFGDSLRSQVSPRSVEVYPVKYPASPDFSSSLTDGVNDAKAHVRDTVSNCPATKVVLGGFSQGAAVVDVLAGVPILGVSGALSPEDAGRVAAVTVFGNPSATMAGGSLPALSPAYASKTIDLCVSYDPICFGTGNILAHGLYVQSGLVQQAASFAAGRL